MLTSTSLQGPTQTAYLARKAATAMAASTGTVADVVLEPQNVGKKQSVFEDNPGDLPADAIKSDEINNQASAEEKDKHTQISEESTMTTAQSVNQQVIVEETTSKNNNEKREIELQPAEKEKSNSESEKNGNPDEPPPQNAGETKSFEEQQKRQRMEDAGIQNPVEENRYNIKFSHSILSFLLTEKPENKVTEEDQDQRMQQQQEMHDAQKQQQSEMKMDVDAHRPESVDNVTTDVTNSPSSSEIPKESKDSKRTWSTQASESENQKERRKEDDDTKPEVAEWQLCNVTAGTDYIPCLDNEKALKKLRTTGHFEHRERHCPEDPPTCLVPLPSGYKRPILWPNSRDKIWYHNVPRTKLAEFKGHQNWVKVTGEFLTFPGGGTQFIHGALHYIDFLQMSVPKIGWGKRTRVILDVGCGVASFGGYIFERDVLAMSFAPKDEHEAQVQFALERGIPAISAVMGSKRLPFPSAVFDLIHCARCRVPWHKEGGLLLLELNRLLRPGGYFVWSATPVYQKLKDDVDIWQEMSALTVSMCWELVTIKRDKLNKIGAAIYRKPTTNDCYDQRKKNEPPMCADDDDSNAAWSVPLQACMHRVPTDASIRGTQWPGEWPSRLQKPPYWLNSSQMGIYGKPAPQDFTTDYKHWKNVVNNTYMKGLGISWDGVRNVMDMRAVYGGFAAALKDMKVWVLNIVTVDSPDTLPIIYERGLFGIYHDWCESFSTYPRTYDLVHADHLLSKLKTRCKLVPVLAEVDRILRPGGKFIVRDESKTIQEVETILKSLHWEIKLSRDQEGILSAQKGDWRPETIAASS
ncbi:Probable methyltransferase PMT27 [Linum perenne]